MIRDVELVLRGSKLAFFLAQSTVLCPGVQGGLPYKLGFKYLTVVKAAGRWHLSRGWG